MRIELTAVIVEHKQQRTPTNGKDGYIVLKDEGTDHSGVAAIDKMFNPQEFFRSGPRRHQESIDVILEDENE